MTLQVSGPISLRDIQGEFGGSATNILLQDYFRGGGLVPDIPANSTIPTSGPIRFQDFFGTTNLVIAIEVGNCNDFAFAGTTVRVRVQFELDGGNNCIPNNSPASFDNWAQPPSPTIGNDWQLRYTVLSGASLNVNIGSSPGAWTTMSSTITFGQEIIAPVATIRSCTVQMQIRDVATQTIQDTKVITVEVENFETP